MMTHVFMPQPKDAAMSILTGDGDWDDMMDQREMLDNMLCSASVTLTATFTVSTTLYLSSPALAPDFDPFQSNKYPKIILTSVQN